MVSRRSHVTAKASDYGQDAHDLLELAFHLWRHVRARLAEVLEVGSREHQHLACAVVPEKVGALLVLLGLRPVEKISLLGIGFLGEEVIGKPDRELSVLGQLLDDRVILRIVLEATTCVDSASDAQPIELAHEVARRTELVMEGLRVLARVA